MIDDVVRTLIMLAAFVAFVYSFFVSGTEVLLAGYRVAMLTVVCMVIWNWMESLRMEVRYGIER
jgi:hypothetical protein